MDLENKVDLDIRGCSEYSLRDFNVEEGVWVSLKQMGVHFLCFHLKMFIHLSLFNLSVLICVKCKESGDKAILPLDHHAFYNDLLKSKIRWSVQITIKSGF